MKLITNRSKINKYEKLTYLIIGFLTAYLNNLLSEYNCLLNWEIYFISKMNQVI